MFYKIIVNNKVIVKSIIDPDDNFLLLSCSSSSPDSPLQSGMDIKAAIPTSSQSVWKGFLFMPDVAKFVSTAYRVSGMCDTLLQVKPTLFSYCIPCYYCSSLINVYFALPWTLLLSNCAPLFGHPILMLVLYNTLA